MKEVLIERRQFRVQKWRNFVRRCFSQRFLKWNIAVSPVDNEEQLARFVLFSKHVGALDQRIKPEAFIPHPYPDLSVTRHKGLSEEQLWKLGHGIATARKRTLYGRADVSAISVRQQALAVEPEPIKGNPNHANILGWPKDKPAQKIIALELAAASAYRCYAPKTP
ncbi:MAG: hypothetical protein WA700_05885 [Acidobacteriaceae bacterium]